MARRFWFVFGVVALTACKGKTPTEQTKNAPAPVASATTPGTIDLPTIDPPSGSIPSTKPMTLAEQVKAQRLKMSEAAEAGKYDDVCAGTPSFPVGLCRFVALVASGKGAERPSAEAIQSFFAREKIKKVSGRVIGEGDGKDRYEVTASGYARHCLLETVDTSFKTTGTYTMWVQEEPKTETVTLKSGKEAEWIVLDESSIAQDLMDVYHRPSGKESEAVAKGLMRSIAGFVPYSELKGDPPVLPTASSASASAQPAGEGTATKATPAVQAAGTGTATAAVPPASNPCSATCSGTSTDAIKQATAARAGTAVMCNKDEPLSGEIVIRVKVGENGETCAASVISNTTGSTKAEQCVRAKMIATYPQPKAGCTEVPVTVRFATKKGNAGESKAGGMVKDPPF